MSSTTTAPFRLKELFESSDDPTSYAEAFGRNFASRLHELDYDAIGRFAEAVAEVQKASRCIYVIANGGSAAVASHFVNDMGVNSIVSGMRGFKVFSLTDNGEALTAVANDTGYEHVFAQQLDCVLEPGDLVVAMSVSGNSPNIVRGLELARKRGARTVALCGFDGGKIRSMADIVVHAPTTKDEYGPAEDIFSVVCHIVSGYLTMRRGRPLHH